MVRKKKRLAPEPPPMSPTTLLEPPTLPPKGGKPMVVDLDLPITNSSPVFSQQSVGNDSGVSSDIESNNQWSSRRRRLSSFSTSDSDSITSSDTTSSSIVSSLLAWQQQRSRLEEIQAVKGTLRKTSSLREENILCINEDVKHFHLDEDDDDASSSYQNSDLECFAGLKVVADSKEAGPETDTIRSNRGTVRGVRNRVRAGIATFQLNDPSFKVKHHQ